MFDTWRHERRAAVLAVIGDEWYEWLGEIVGVVVVGLVAFGVLPVWAIALAVLTLLRPLSRLLMGVAAGLLSS